MKSGDWVDYGMISNTPELFGRALAKRRDGLQDVKVRGAMLLIIGDDTPDVVTRVYTNIDKGSVFKLRNCCIG